MNQPIYINPEKHIFLWPDLIGKTLKISGNVSNEGHVVLAKDINTDKIYLLDLKIKEESK